MAKNTGTAASHRTIGGTVLAIVTLDNHTIRRTPTGQILQVPGQKNTTQSAGQKTVAGANAK